jgi:hypothetical protein
LFVLTLFFSVFNASALFEPALIDGANYGDKAGYDAIIKEVSGWGKVTKAETKRLILEGGASPERDRFIAYVNKSLSAQNLPNIINSPNLKIKRSCVIGFKPEPDCFQGVEISDGTHFFCFKCEQGHNAFGVGIRRQNWKSKPSTDIPATTSDWPDLKPGKRNTAPARK